MSRYRADEGHKDFSNKYYNKKFFKKVRLLPTIFYCNYFTRLRYEYRNRIEYSRFTAPTPSAKTTRTIPFSIFFLSVGVHPAANPTLFTRFTVFRPEKITLFLTPAHNILEPKKSIRFEYIFFFFHFHPNVL